MTWLESNRIVNRYEIQWSLKVSNLIFSHMVTQCTQCHLFTTQLIFSPFYCGNLVIYKASMHTWIYFGKNYFLLLITGLKYAAILKYNMYAIKFIYNSIVWWDRTIAWTMFLWPKPRYRPFISPQNISSYLFEVILIPWILISDVCSFASGY